MPTGYTADVADGKVTDFPTFALRCARNFGALIPMRDERFDAPIPDEFRPSPYYAQEAAKLEAQLSSLRDLTPAAAAERMQEEYDAALRSWQERRDRREQTASRNEWVRALRESLAVAQDGAE